MRFHMGLVLTGEAVLSSTQGSWTTCCLSARARQLLLFLPSYPPRDHGSACSSVAWDGPLHLKRRGTQSLPRSKHRSSRSYSHTSSHIWSFRITSSRCRPRLSSSQPSYRL